jgi:hypothetical protein
MSSSVGPGVPSGWQLTRSGGPRPFTTWREYVGEDDVTHVWESRRHRKGLGARRAGAGTRSGYWAPDRLAWWVAVVFVVGSVLFVLGAAASLTPSLFGGDETLLSITAESFYSVGALLYTIAVYGQILESLNEDDQITESGDGHPPSSWRWFGFEPRNLSYLWAVVFLIGALVFNYESIAALLSGLDVLSGQIGLWWTSLLGAVAFFVASVLQGVEAGHGYLPQTVREVSWWVSLMFALGSLGFVVGSLPGFSVAGTYGHSGEPGASIVKIGFLLGGIAFTIGSALMLRELDEEIRGAEAGDAAEQSA